MSAYKAIRYLLANDSDVVAAVGARIYPVTVPQKTTADQVIYPCIVIGIISETSRTLVSMKEPDQMVKARVQVTVLAESYGAKESLMDAVIKACKSGLAVIDGVRVNAILSLQLGPDFRDEQVKLFMQSQDFQVQYNQAS